jgi:carbon monoxide dehydrogenase subunit G
MLSVTSSTHVPAPPEAVWELISDTTRYAEWVEGTDAVTRTDGPAWEGSTYDEANTLLGPWKARSSWRIVEYTPHRRQVHTSTDVPLARRFDVVMELEPQAEGTLFVVTLNVEPALGPIGALMARLMRGAAETENRRTVANLADLVSREQRGIAAIPDPVGRSEPGRLATTEARRLLRADALLELGLGVPLATGTLTGLHDALDLPRPASERVATAFGASLLPAAGLLWAASRRPRRGRVLAIAAVNALSGAVLAGWIARERDDTGPLGAAAVGGTAVALLALAAAEARVSHRLP